jgi:hypothetical protein
LVIAFRVESDLRQPPLTRALDGASIRSSVAALMDPKSFFCVGKSDR